MARVKQSYGLMRLAGAGIIGYNYVVGGGAGLNNLKSGDVAGWSQDVLATMRAPVGHQIVTFAPYLFGVIGNKAFGRDNPGVKIGSTKFKIF